MVSSIKKILSLPDLKAKISFTLLLLFICRIGAHIPVPGINSEAAMQVFRQATGGGQNLFQLMDVFSGGAFAQMTIIALGVMPYISASIIMQLLTAMIPSVQREVKENPEVGRRKIGKWTRILTLLIAFIQSGIFAKVALSFNQSTPGIIVPHIYDIQMFGLPILFYLLFISTMTAGSLLLMWVGEQITERGIGNGISMIIMLGILSSLPRTIGTIIRQLNLESQEAGQLTFSSLIALVGVFVFIIVGTILIIQGVRKVPLQYARRGTGHEQGSAHIPLKLNYAGVIPVIFASSLLMFPATIGQFLGSSSVVGRFASAIGPGTIGYSIAYVGLIFFFTYFWTATQFHPDQIASDMKKSGAFIPGVRQGKPTQDYLQQTMSRITFAGATFLALIAILPTIVGRLLNVDSSITYFFGGTSLLILVGVILDTNKQIESHLLMKRYEGFMRRGSLRRQ